MVVHPGENLAAAGGEAVDFAGGAVGRFLDSECFVSTGAWVKVSDLWDAWAAWATDDGAEPLSKTAFGEAVERRGYPAVKGTGGMRIRRGLGLLSADEDDS